MSTNAVDTQGMKLQMSPAGGVAASGTVTLSTSLAADESVTIEGHEFAFKASGATGDQVPLMGTLSESARMLAHVINDSSTSGIDGIVTAAASGAVVTVTAVSPGTGGNALTFTKTGTHVTLSGAGTLTGGAGTGYTDIVEVTNINGPNETVKLNDVTHLGSSAREKKPAIPDSGEITFTINWQPQDDTHQALHTALINRTLDNYKIVYTDSPASEATFQAYVTSHGPKGGLDAQMTADLTLTITGGVTYTPGA